MHGLAQQCGLAALGEHECHERYRDGTDHDEREGRVPGAEEVEKILNLGGVAHARQNQAQTEDESCDERGEYGNHGVFTLLD